MSVLSSAIGRLKHWTNVHLNTGFAEPAPPIPGRALATGNPTTTLVDAIPTTGTGAVKLLLVLLLIVIAVAVFARRRGG